MDNFIIETSARHVHVTRETLDILFGKGFELEVKKPLSQPGQYASNQKVEVVGPKSSLKCSILGPVRPENQVELSFTDARAVGIVAVAAPVICYVLQSNSERWFGGYTFSYELLIVNAAITFAGMMLLVKREKGLTK